ncbi:MAG: lipocalin family protein [Spirochaetota bacterium]
MIRIDRKSAWAGRKLALGSLVFISLSAALLSCATAPIPAAAPIVEGFDKARYLGTWYEIARFDFAFERNLNNTTAEYALRDDGRIAVVNRGYNYVTGKRQVARGKARFRGPETRAALEVSFFGPFYAAYNVVALDKEYRYALVAGGSLDYLWILSREKSIPEEVRRNYLAVAESLGYDTSRLIWVEHDK